MVATMVAFGLLLGPIAAAAPLPPAQAQTQTQALDHQIASYLQQQFAKNKDLSDVRIAVDDRVVTLSGSVPDYRGYLKANHLARQVDSVNGLIDHLAVNAPQVPDSQLRNEISGALTYDRIGQGQIFNALKIGVKNGIVTVGGQVVNYADRDSALAIIADTKGVRGVRDQIKVQPVSSFDDQIRVQAARRIYGNSSLRRYWMDPAHPIRILVNNGHVTLAGVVDSQMDKQLAYTAVSGIPGVFSVKNELVVAGGGK